MSALTWDGWETSPEEDVEAGGAPVLANWHYLRGALRRERGLLLATALAGLLVALAVTIVVPAGHRATALVVLTHDPLVDPSRAMETDVSLATTRAVAQRTIDELGLAATPEQLLDRVEVSSESADTAVIAVTADSDAEAVRRLSAYTAAYLAIRTEQARAQADALSAGSQERIAQLRGQVDTLTEQIDRTAATGDLGSALLGDLVGQRSQLIAQISSLEQTVEDAELRVASIVNASRVVDPPRADPPAGLVHRLVLPVTGMIGGAGLGVGLVLGRALTSTRLRRRAEVGLALGTTVTVSVGRLDGGPAWWAPVRLPQRLLGRTTRPDRQVERQRLARAIERQFPARGWRQRLIVGCIDNAAEVALAAADLALTLREQGRVVHLVDMTEQAVLAGAVARLSGGADPDGDDAFDQPPAVLRPSSVPSLSAGPATLSETLTPDIAQLTFPAAGHMVLVLADLHPAVGAEHLHPWAERTVVAVTAGRSSAERVSACGQMLRAAGVHIAAAVLLHADPDDESSGRAWAPSHAGGRPPEMVDLGSGRLAGRANGAGTPR